MREYARASASIRAALTEAGIDPAQNDGFRNFVSGEHEVARWPDTPELQQADAAFIAQDPKLSSRQSLADEVRRANRALRRPAAARSEDHVALRLVRLVARRPAQRSIGPAITVDAPACDPTPRMASRGDCDAAI